MTHLGWTAFVGGLAFFFLGLRFSRDGMGLIAGERLRLLMGRLARRTLFAVGADALAAMALQSSRAAIAIAVHFASTELLTLPQAFAVALGADIGTGLIICLLAFPEITGGALVLVAGGILLDRFARLQRIRAMGTVLLGFGLVLFGMYLLYGWAAPLGENLVASQIVSYLTAHRGAMFLLSLAATLAIRQTAATIAFAIALAAANLLSFEGALPLIFGANVGAAIMAGAVCLRHGTVGRRVAVFLVAVKGISVLAAFSLIGFLSRGGDAIDAWLAEVVSLAPLSAGFKIALAHVALNLAIAIVFIPLVIPASMLIRRFIPEPFAKEEGFGPKYLDDEDVGTPELAFAHARREILRIARIAHDMFASILQVFRMDADFDHLIEATGGADDKIDLLEKAVRFYLARVSQKTLTEVQAVREVALITVAGDLEDVGDSIQRGLMALADKKRRKLARFSEEGWREIGELHKLVLENFDLMISMLTHPDEDIARKVVRHEQHLNDVEQELRQSHLHRLHDRIPESFESSTIHLDILGSFRMINAKLTKICQTAVGLA